MLSDSGCRVEDVGVKVSGSDILVLQLRVSGIALFGVARI